VRLDFDIAEVLIRLGVDYPDFAVVLTSILTAVSYIEEFGMGIVSDTVGTKIQLDRIQQVESVAAEYPEHPVISTSDEHFIEGWNVGNTLCFFETGYAFQPFGSLKIDDFERAILEAGHKEPLAFDIHIHVVNAAFDVRHGNGLDESKGSMVLRMGLGTQ